MSTLKSMKIAIEGCCHGELNKIYGTIKLMERRQNIKVDLVLICGDFQALRNRGDLQCMAVPDKYKQMGDFHAYYDGRAKAPYPTIFIGGNHEASNYLWELYHGGWVADNIYYLGNAGVIQYNGVRIGGLSGIYNAQHYHKGHYEKAPYDKSQLRSIYHVREYNVNKLLQIKQPMDIFLSHDWPRGIERFGDLKSLLRFKKYFYNEVMKNDLGSPPNEALFTQLKPAYWFAAHLHVKFPAKVNHHDWQNKLYSPQALEVLGISSQQQQQTINPDEIQIDDDDDDDDDDEGSTAQQPKENKITQFLSLDKCLPRRQFLQIIDVPIKNEDGFTYDLEWLAITRAMHPYLSLQSQPIPIPPKEQLQETIKQEEMYLDNLLECDDLDLKIPSNFEPTATSKDHGIPIYLNPQSTAFCNLIGIENKINVDGQPPRRQQNQQPPSSKQSRSNQQYQHSEEQQSSTEPINMKSPSKKAKLDLD
ncbi:lariat debranching enzyme, C-terminal domain-containing protein [Chlamydoabsidia padenii]|nr:lariat debranching enzyme, C-terminal domain-containing protein [Chlamydoabsidia padenii]